MLMVAALVMWALTPAPDGALLALGRTLILVLAGPMVRQPKWPQAPLAPVV